MSNPDETKSFMKKLVQIISSMSETLQGLEQKITTSNRQMAYLTQQIEAIASKISKLDVEVEEEFLKIGKDTSPSQAMAGLQKELSEMQKGLNEIPDDLLDGELEKLLDEEGEEKKADKKGDS